MTFHLLMYWGSDGERIILQLDASLKPTHIAWREQGYSHGIMQHKSTLSAVLTH